MTDFYYVLETGNVSAEILNRSINKTLENAKKTLDGTYCILKFNAEQPDLGTALTRDETLGIISDPLNGWIIEGDW